MSPVRIALYQAQSGIDPAANARALVGAVAEAAAGGARMLFTPEMSGMLDRDRERAMGKARAEGDDAVLAAVRAAAAEHIAQPALSQQIRRLEEEVGVATVVAALTSSSTKECTMMRRTWTTTTTSRIRCWLT